MVTLACVACHPALPLLNPGDCIGISRARAGGLMLHIPGTIRILGALMAAMVDGALTPPPPDDPYWNELQAIIFAARDELLARADDVLVNCPVAHSQAS